MTPLIIVAGLPDVIEQSKEPKAKLAAAEKALKETAEGSPERKDAAAAVAEAKKAADYPQRAYRGKIQLVQEIGGLLGRILLAVLLLFIPSRTLIRLFLVPGIALFPLTYFKLVSAEYTMFAAAIFFCGLLTVAQFSFLSEFLPRVYPMHLRGTGGSFATNFGGRMIGTMAATLNTEILSKMFTDIPRPMQVAYAAAVIGGAVYLIAFVATFLLPSPHEEVEKQAAILGPDEALKEPKSETVD